MPYLPAWHAMQRFTDSRDENTADELWAMQHAPVFTNGLAGKAEHILAPGNIPVVQVDRGGQVTYHGPGQLMLYPLIDLRRQKIGVRDLVTRIENATISALKEFGIESSAKPDAPGVYVHGEKIMALGLRIRRGCSFHGLALNVCMDLSPFERINPCGYTALKHTSVYDEAGPADVDVMADCLIPILARSLGFVTIAQAAAELP
jgi:lipoyl(octanoyl) transferase